MTTPETLADSEADAVQKTMFDPPRRPRCAACDGHGTVRSGPYYGQTCLSCYGRQEPPPPWSPPSAANVAEGLRLLIAAGIIRAKERQAADQASFEDDMRAGRDKS